jgi:hypothetical protein
MAYERACGISKMIGIWARSVAGSLAAQDGIALLIALIALSVLSLAGFYMGLNAAGELRISDNYESGILAAAAARAGLNHARALIRGLPFDDLLKGPDNEYNSDPSYLTQARKHAFRNWVSWAVAHALDTTNPGGNLAGLPDDGLINAGGSFGNSGTPLIPAVGVPITAPNPSGPGTIIVGRYFVKVTDNNGDVSEMIQDPADNPFFDGDGIVVIRSVGVARTIREQTGDALRQNSVAVVEGRFKRRSTFNLGAPLVVQGSAVAPSSAGMFEGAQFAIDGGNLKPGIAAIDVSLGDGASPSQQISSQVARSQRGNIRGLGGSPSIRDITAEISADPDKALLLNPAYLYSFAGIEVPRFADRVFHGNQEWPGDSSPDIGVYDPALPDADPSQHPKVTLVEGDLSINGTVAGGGLLVVRGRVYGTGRLVFNGLVLLLGAGDLNLDGLSLKISGGLYVVRLINEGKDAAFDVPKLTIAGDAAIVADSKAIEMGVRLIPPIQIGWREIMPTLDP